MIVFMPSLIRWNRRTGEFWTIGVNHPYLQSSPTLRREVRNKPHVFEHASKARLQIVERLHRLSDPEDYLAETVVFNHKNDPEVKTSLLCIFLFFEQNHGKRVGISGTFVGDIVTTTYRYSEPATDKVMSQ